MIWGLMLEPGCIYTRSVTTETHLSLATLDCRGKVFAGTDPVKVSHVVLKTNDCEQLLCSLVQGLILQQPLDLKVMPNEEVAFSNQGNCCVYITGYSIETEYNYKLDDSPSEGSLLENPVSTYEVHTEWETEEDFKEKGQEDGEPAAGDLTTAEIREEGETQRSDTEEVTDDAIEEEEQSLNTSNKLTTGASEEMTLNSQDDEDVFCIAVKEEPEDAEDTPPPELSGDHDHQEMTEGPGTQTSRENTFEANVTAQMTAQVDEGESDSVQQTSLSVSETLSPALLGGGRIDNLQEQTATGQIVNYSSEDDCCGYRQGEKEMLHSDQNCSENLEVEQTVNKLPHYSREKQKSPGKIGAVNLAPLKTTHPRVVSTSSQVASPSKKPHRPPTVAEMISKVGDKKYEPPIHSFAERRGEISGHREPRLDLLSCSPRRGCGDLRLQFPSYDSTGRGTRFQCRYCSKTLNCRRSLIHHEMIHTGDKPFSCRFCQKTFIQKSQWKVHERIHTGVKPFICKHCGKAFSRLYNKRMHAKTCQSFNTFNIVQREKNPD